MTIDWFKELKRVGIGMFLALPVVGIYFIGSWLVSNNYVSANTLAFTLFGISMLFMCWTAGGAYESIQEMKRVQTDNAFRKLGHRD